MAQPNQNYIYRADRSTGPVPRNSTSMVDETLSKPSEPASKEIFTCDQCPKSFNRRENLSRHQKTHSASPSHCCTKCGKGFTRSDLLKRHEAGHQRWDQSEGKVRGGTPTMNVPASVKRRKINPGVQDGSASNSPGSQMSPASLDSGRAIGLPIKNDQPPLQRTMMNDPFQGGIPGPTYPSFSNIPTNNQFGHGPNSAHIHNSVYPHLQGNNNGMAGFSHLDPLESFIPFDFSSFLLPSDVGPVNQEWFSFDFYSAMRETGNDWAEGDELLDPEILNATQKYGGTVESAPHLSGQHEAQYTQRIAEPNSSTVSEEERRLETERISRASSPPNEASEEDKWPFMWNPKSNPILKAEPVTIPHNHHLLKSHDARYDISETTLLRLQAFLQPQLGQEYHQSAKPTFVLPSLPTINVFIRLFFEHFSHQMPVLHHSTVNTDTDLPPPLLAAIVIIGATYSHLRHSRRFALVLLDIARWHLRIALECDNSLMRDPMIIFAQALICHTGLWCGNKRAFELAEVDRGGLITYIRRTRFGEQLSPATAEGISTKANGGLHGQWKSWISEESQRRLAWIIYAIDCQFPSLLNLPPTISIGEVRNLGCPCDEEFWHATSARNWKNLLGPATVPPSRSFSAAVGPFLLATMPGGDMIGGSKQGISSMKQLGQLPMLNLNTWSAFLVLLTITHQIFQFSQESMITVAFIDDTCDEAVGDHDSGETIKLLRKLHSIRRKQIADALHFWSKAYLTRSQPTNHASSRHFHASSVVIHHLSTILLDVPLSDIQGAIGKDGMTGISQAIVNLTAWARRSPEDVEQVAFNAVKSIISLAQGHVNDGGIRSVDTAPYSLITLFLCHVVLWAFANVSTEAQKRRLLDTVDKSLDLKSSPFVPVLRRGFGIGSQVSAQPNWGGEGRKVLFRNAAEMLTRLGTWGASLNLALLLHWRAEM